MKKNILLALSLSLSQAFASNVQMEQFDQEKLADLLGRLPLTVRDRVITDITEPTTGVLVTSDFPKNLEAGFKAHCESKYFNNSPYPSSSVCTMEIDEHHHLMDTKYDENRLVVEDEEIAKALFDNISYGLPEKDFRSFGKDHGTSFEGKYTYIFHYRMKCSEKSCVMNFSKIFGRDPDDKSFQN